MKRRIKQNIYGNWNGYEGARKVVEFGFDAYAAGYWLLTGKVDFFAGYADENIVAVKKAISESL